jgi:integrase/recombinase XerD
MQSACGRSSWLRLTTWVGYSQAVHDGATDVSAVPDRRRHCRAGLLGAIPAQAHWRLSSLPRYLTPEAVERVIDSCNVSSPVGMRDRAILLLLARLGLRAGDIVRMRLDDIDWRGAWVHVSGKSRRRTRLPLTQEVGDAIVL